MTFHPCSSVASFFHRGWESCHLTAHARDPNLYLVGKAQLEALGDWETQRLIERLAGQGGHQGQSAEPGGGRRAAAFIKQASPAISSSIAGTSARAAGRTRSTFSTNTTAACRYLVETAFRSRNDPPK